MTYRWLSFLTDYGLRDGFVAACHGVIARIAPDVRVIDVTHSVPPQGIRHGAEVLAQTAPYLPDAVHLAVVDPGVGTARRGVVVVADRGLLVGPDNGLLVPAAEALGGVRAAYELAEPAYRLPEVSATFHGRDVFAPAAAHLVSGVLPERLGPPVPELVRLPEPKVVARPGQLVAEVLTVDHFGNVQLAATAADLDAAELGRWLLVHCGQNELPAARGRTFADRPIGEAVLFTDSAGRLAVAVNGGSAAGALGLTGYPAAQLCTITSSPTAT
ncbi:SAM hydrolase/SAM-dependent halogenase family protein [Amycolatopsis anabasis]|uniref:SAM hydrolase/SAM-dependent halogenase family protein n=1 Tax=Amycolatopsis anabasis TaxID=1840409 RepID=UPI00131E7808